jgi:hypothetical protein
MQRLRELFSQTILAATSEKLDGEERELDLIADDRRRDDPLCVAGGGNRRPFGRGGRRYVAPTIQRYLNGSS